MDGYIDGPGVRLDTQAGLTPVSSLGVVSVGCLLVDLSVQIIFFSQLDMLDRSGSGCVQRPFLSSGPTFRERERVVIYLMVLPVRRRIHWGMGRF